MLTPTYLSATDRESLEKFQDELMRCTDEKRRIILQEDIAKLEGKRKEIKNLTFDECLEFKNQLTKKMNKAMGIGKTHLAKPFYDYLRLVNERMASIQVDTYKAAVEKAKEKPDERVNSKTKQEGELRNPWAINLDDED